MSQAVTDSVSEPMAEPVMGAVADPVSEAVTAMMPAAMMPATVMPATVMLREDKPRHKQRHNDEANAHTTDKRLLRHDAPSRWRTTTIQVDGIERNQMAGTLCKS